MSGFSEPTPDLVAPNPGGAEDPLGESVLDPANPWLRVFAPRDLRIVIGRHQEAEREVHCAVAQADGVPIHRRVCGGGAVVLAPAMAVIALRLQPGRAAGPGEWFTVINRALAPAIAGLTGIEPLVRGHGDLCLPAPDGQPRKILGASLRQTARLVAYLGVVLVGDATPAMERYLRFPSRQPDYRAGRGHAGFCTGLAAHGVALEDALAALHRGCAADLAGLAIA